MVSKTGLKMFCDVVLISIIDCIAEMISTHCGMSGDSSDEISWFLSPLSLSQFCKITKNQFIANLLPKKNCINKSVPKNTIRSTGFPKPKTNFFPALVSISVISNRTRNSCFKRRNCQVKRLLWISKILTLLKKL